MGLGDFHRHRQLASAFALVGILIYSALIPGHVVSQATMHALAGADGQAGVPAAFEPICHRGIARSQDPSKPGEPSAPHKKCPFCSGYASFVTADAATSSGVVLDAERVSPSLVVFDEGLVEREAKRPNNRGPPLEL
jgi:hypothetical protein